MIVMLRDPTAEITSELRPRYSALDTLAGKCVALMDIGKMRGDEILDITLNCHAVVIALSDCGSCTSCSTHDLFTLDERQIPGVSVLTEEFADAFEVQRKAIGFGGAAIFVPHPMQNRTKSELQGFADKFFDEILSRICVTPPPVSQPRAA